eukprot:s1255_g10.t1
MQRRIQLSEEVQSWDSSHSMLEAAKKKPVTYLPLSIHTFEGRVRSVHEGVYSVDVAGGGIKVGLNSVTPCSEEKLEKVVLSKKALVWHLDAWSGYKTRNAAQHQLRPERWASVGRKFSNGTPRQASQEPHLHRRAVPTLHGVAIAKSESKRPFEKRAGL